MYAFYLVQGTEKRISLISKTSWTGQGSTVINLSDSTPTRTESEWPSNTCSLRFVRDS
jgi:hypothetical protein